MSWYVWYKLGYEDKDGKIYPLGPFNRKGDFIEIFDRSRSFASDLWARFGAIPPEKVSDELRKVYEKDVDFPFEERKVKYIYLKDLPDGSFIKSGYFLIDDIHYYEKNHDIEDIFYEKLSPHEYLLRTENELKFGAPKPQKDCDGYDITPHSVSEYAFYMYPDYWCEEYEAFLIRQAAETYGDYGQIPDGARIVVLEEDG